MTAASTTLLEAFFTCQQASRGDLGKALTADAVNNSGTDGYVEDFSEFNYSKLGSDDLRGRYVWRYNIAEDDDDCLRRVKSVSSTTRRITVDGGIYSNTSDLDYVLIGFDPREALTAMRDAYAGMPLRKEVVLAPPESDWDMERPDQDYFDGTLDGSQTNVTAVKTQAAPENKVTGTYALELLSTAVGGFQLTSKIRVVPGTIWTIAPCFRVAAGEWTVQLYDDSHSAVFGDSYAYSGAEFMYVRFNPVTIPDDCNYLRVKFTATGNNADMWLDSIPARPLVGAVHNLEDWIDDSFRLPLIHRIKLQQLLKDSNNLYPAPLREYAGDLVNGVHYQVRIDNSAAARNVLDFEPAVELGSDIFYLVTERDRRLTEPFDALTDSTTAAIGMLTAYLMVGICDLLEHKTHDPYWAKKKQDYEEKLGAEVAPRAEQQYQPAREVIKVRM